MHRRHILLVILIAVLLLALYFSRAFSIYEENSNDPNAKTQQQKPYTLVIGKSELL